MHARAKKNVHRALGARAERVGQGWERLDVRSGLLDGVIGGRARLRGLDRFGISWVGVWGLGLSL